ncbi:MAG: RidA family protein [Micrococcales bacterium]|nr:RidA family protein [Micrococcales bacterium]
MTPEGKLAELGLELPDPFPPAADYVSCRRAGNLLYISGHGPMRNGKAVYTGKVGAELDVATGAKSAELTMLGILASIKAEIGDLSRITGWLRLSVFVNATADFQLHHLVADGASKLLTALYGPNAAHARFAVGIMSLPFSISTEIEAIAQFD